MRRKVAEQLGLVTVTIDHVRARELAMMSRVIDALPKALELVYDDLLDAKGVPDTGREAMTAEQVLRAMVIKQRFALSYEGLSFELADSNSVRAFCRVPMSMSSPAKSAAAQHQAREGEHVAKHGSSAHGRPGRPVERRSCHETASRGIGPKSYGAASHSSSSGSYGTGRASPAS